MADQHTLKMLESLADLFLTGTTAATMPPPARQSPQPTAAAAPAAPVAPAPAPAPKAAAAPAPVPPAPDFDFDDQLEGPPPIRLMPKLATLEAVRRSRRQRPQTEPIDESGPRLRITDYEEPDDEPQPTPADIEIVFLGSLPGYAGPWLTQYAQWRANRLGLVAVLHLDEQQVDVELIGASQLDPPRPVATGDSLREALHALEDVRLWLIHPATHDATLLRLLDSVDRWTILCGADAPAVLGATELIRELIELDAEHSPSAVERHIGVMVMGSEGAAADDALQRISNALDDVLDRPVQLLGAIRQMGPVNVRIVGSFAYEQGDWPHVLRAMAQSRPRVVKSPLDAVPPSITMSPTHRRPQRLRPTPEPAPARASEPVAPSLPPPVVEQPAPQVAAATPITPPTPAPPSPSSPQPVATDAPDLSTFLPGGLALQARYPRRPETQLVLDQDGCLHLLRRHEGDLQSLHAAIVDLIEVQAWVREHVELLALTQRQCRFDTSAQPVLHLFTDQSRLAGALLARLGPFLRLHLLQRVQTGTESTWFCADLN